jgi:hypothetical protein
MKNIFPSIFIFSLLIFLLFNSENLHKEKTKLKTRKSKGKKTSKQKIRKTIKKGYKVTSTDPIEPGKLKLRFDLGRKNN